MDRNPGHVNTPDRRETVFLLGLFFGALLLRLIYFWQIKDYPFMHHPSGQPSYFLGKAFAIARGDLQGGSEPFFYAPFYYYFLALIKLFSDYTTTLRHAFIVQSVIGSAGILLHYFLAKAVFNRKVAVVTAVMAFFYAPYIFFETDAVAISLVIFLNNLVFLCLLHFARKGKYRMLLAAGLFTGLSILARPNLLPVAGLMACWIFFVKSFPLRKRIKGVFLFGAMVWLCILPVTVGNYLKCGEVFLISTNGPVNFYIGNNRHASGYFDVPEDMPWLNSEKMHRLPEILAPALQKEDLSWQEANTYLLQKTRQEIRAHPLRWFRLLVVKLYLSLYRFEMPNPDYYYFRLALTPFLRLFFLSFGLIAPLGLAGMVFSRKNPGQGLLKLFFFGYIATLLITFVSQRYRLPLVPVLMIFSAFFVVHVAECIRERHLGKIFLRAGAALFFLFLLNLPGAFLRTHFNLSIRTPEWDIGNGYHRLALAYRKSGDLQGFESAMARSRHYLKEEH